MKTTLLSIAIHALGVIAISFIIIGAYAIIQHFNL